MRAVFALIVMLAATGTRSEAPSTPYDPLRVDAGARAEFLDRVVRDDERRRDIPVRVYRLAVASSAPSPVILFSHGLGGSRENNRYLGEHWARRGFVVVFVQHPGSDESVWRDVPANERVRALRDAADVQNFLARVRDVPAVLDALERWNAQRGDALFRRLDLGRVGMSGHSFGAVTTQAVSGQHFRAGRDFTDRRIDAAIALSPSSPRRGSPGDAFRAVHIPWLLMTGTRDTAPIGGQTVESRLAVFPALPSGADVDSTGRRNYSHYELVLDGAEHSAFSDRELPGDRAPRNPNHHRAVLALGTAFFDAYLGGDRAAREWLDGAQARSVLESGDRWQTK